MCFISYSINSLKLNEAIKKDEVKVKDRELVTI